VTKGAKNRRGRRRKKRERKRRKIETQDFLFIGSREPYMYAVIAGPQPETYMD
jgi:hypothetical protein